jgi:hypothetical protein
MELKSKKPNENSKKEKPTLNDSVTKCSNADANIEDIFTSFDSLLE